MKKILVVITTAFVPFGGLTTVMMNYYRAVNKDNLQIDFASTNECPDVLKKELDANNSNYYNLGKRQSAPVSYMSNLKKVLKNNYDIIHVHGNSATCTMELYTAKKCGVKKRMIHIHNSTCSYKMVHNLLKPVFDKSYTDAIACSKKAGEWIFGSEDNYKILNNSINTKRYCFSPEKRSTVRKELGISDNQFVLGHVGKLNEQKNHKYLLEIFAALLKNDDNASLILVGDGNLKEDIVKQCESLGITDKVKMVGVRSNVEDYLSAMDVFVFPSLWEGLPLSLIEAQSAGLKCITSENVTKEGNVTGNVEYKSLDNTDVWVNTILGFKGYDRVLEAEENLKKIQQNGYDIDINSEQLRDIYLK